MSERRARQRRQAQRRQHIPPIVEAVAGLRQDVVYQTDRATMDAVPGMRCFVRALQRGEIPRLPVEDPPGILAIWRDMQDHLEQWEVLVVDGEIVDLAYGAVTGAEAYARTQRHGVAPIVAPDFEPLPHGGRQLTQVRVPLRATEVQAWYPDVLKVLGVRLRPAAGPLVEVELHP